MAKSKHIYWLLLIIPILIGCSIQGEPQTPNGDLVFTETPLPTETPVDTPTPLAPVGVFLTPPGSDPNLVADLYPLIAEYIRAEGFRFQILETMMAEDFSRDDFQLVVVVPPFPDLEGLAQLTPGTKFLALGFNDLDPLDNLSVLRSGGGDFDVQGFIAGYIAAMITLDWRVGVLSVQESEDALAAREGFRVGVKYYCGLCNPKYAPTGVNYIYPKYIDLPAEASDIEIEANVNFLIDRFVNTFYIVPGVGDPKIYSILTSNEKLIIGSGSDFREEYSNFWVASLEYDLLAAFENFWSAFLTSDVGFDQTPPLLITDVNSNLLSPGKVRLVEKILEEVSSGYIKTSFE